ncbi:MAG TPA: hypothetical protein VIE67_11715 [Rudaea sp.]|uniref:hypothetical protein n=1 Tax=Rudaea sp. TaxID=2136325 RepID=UPI002F94821F
MSRSNAKQPRGYEDRKKPMQQEFVSGDVLRWQRTTDKREQKTAPHQHGSVHSLSHSTHFGAGY